MESIIYLTEPRPLLPLIPGRRKDARDTTSRMPLALNLPRHVPPFFLLPQFSRFAIVC